MIKEILTEEYLECLTLHNKLRIRHIKSKLTKVTKKSITSILTITYLRKYMLIGHLNM